MTAKSVGRRREASQNVHSALDALLPSLELEEVGRLASDLTELAGRPGMLLKVLSFARTMAEDRGGGAPTAPPLRLVGGGHGDLMGVEEGARRLDAVTEVAAPEVWAHSELLGPEAVIERLGVSRSTLHNWRRGGRVIALRKGLRNHVYPMRQFSGSAPLVGIAETLVTMTDPEEAWGWLVTPNGYTEDEPPLALLERGQVEAVRQAADSALDFA
jgi:hypothetical protein